MNSLPLSTQQRLRKIPQIPSVWEGDRRPLNGMQKGVEVDDDAQGDCILWVDGSEGFVRSMDIVSPEMGIEAVVRTLLKAIESPHSPAKPARPQKIVVRNREIQFFLRGALQSLDINIDYVPELPLIDELFRSFESMGSNKPPSVPSFYERPLKQTSHDLWMSAPWDLLADHEIIAIELEGWETSPIYACVMGMLGQEYGVILYRSLDSLKQFRLAAIEESAPQQLEKVFLSQDCWFLNYKAIDEDDEDEDFDLEELDSDQVESVLGSIHPLEGIRPFLDEEEAKTIYYALQALIRFVDEHEDELSEDTIGAVSKQYRLPAIANSPNKSKEKINVKVSTLPDLAKEFLDLMDDDDDDDDDDDFSLNNDLIPDNSFLSLGMIPWEAIATLRKQRKTEYPSQEAIGKGDGLPVVVVQTTRAKAKEMIDVLRSEGGVKGIYFNPGEDPWSDDEYELGILQTESENLHVFGEFLEENIEHQKARQKWNSRCKETKGYCGILIAMGVTGTSRGNPKLTDILAVFESKFLDAKALKLGVLQLRSEFE